MVKSIKKVSLILSLIGMLSGLKLPGECDCRDILDFSELRQVTRKNSGMNKGGVYKDKMGNTWFVKDYTSADQSNVDEFLGGKLMKIVLGKDIAEVKLVRGEGELVASKLLTGFVPSIKADLDGKKVLGEERLVVLMDWIGLGDRHGGNQGFLITQDEARASRVDYDSVFEFDKKDPNRIVIKLNEMHNPNFEEIKHTIEEISKINEAKIIDVFASSVCQLQEVKSRVVMENQMKRCNHLLQRRNTLSEILLAVEWIIEGLKAVEKEDAGQLFKYCLNESKDQKAVIKAFGKTFMSMVFVKGDRKAVKYLREQMSVDIDIKDEQGRTALFDLVRHGRYHEAKLLIDLGADVNARDNSQRTPLFEAAEFSDVLMVSKLKDWGADLNAVSNKGKTPLFYAAEYGKHSVLTYLLGLKEVDINVQDKKGKTALFDAARNGRKDMVELLVKHDIKVGLTDQEGKTAKFYSALLGHEDVVKLLEEAGDGIDCKVDKSRPRDPQWGFWSVWPGQ